MDILTVLILSLIAGASTAVGGVICNYKRISKRVLQAALSGSTGVLLAILLLGAMPSAITLGGVGYASLGFILGGVVFMVTGFLFPHTYLNEKYEDRLYSILKTGSLILTGLVLYNFTAGLVFGSGSAFSGAMGAAIFTALILQNIPRGIALYAPLEQTGMIKKNIFLMLLFSAVPLFVGSAVMFAVISGALPVVLSTGIAFSAGAMSFIFIDQMMPIIKGGRDMHETAIAMFIGIFIGLLLLGI